jgi:hypothetical protein
VGPFLDTVMIRESACLEVSRRSVLAIILPHARGPSDCCPRRSFRGRRDFHVAPCVRYLARRVVHISFTSSVAMVISGGISGWTVIRRALSAPRGVLLPCVWSRVCGFVLSAVVSRVGSPPSAVRVVAEGSFLSAQLCSVLLRYGSSHKVVLWALSLQLYSSHVWSMCLTRLNVVSSVCSFDPVRLLVVVRLSPVQCPYFFFFSASSFLSRSRRLSLSISSLALPLFLVRGVSIVWDCATGFVSGSSSYYLHRVSRRSPVLFGSAVLRVLVPGCALSVRLVLLFRTLAEFCSPTLLYVCSLSRRC